MNLIHSLPSERQSPERFFAAIEISAGTSSKYEIDHETGALVLDRFLSTSTHYPHNYGFIPKTWADDGDPLDVLVISSGPIIPMALVECHAIGLLEMKDGGRVDEKIIAVPEKDPFYGSFRSIAELPSHVEEELRHFFQVYKELEHGKTTIVEGYLGPEAAKKAILRGLALYRKEFPDR